MSEDIHSRLKYARMSAGYTSAVGFASANGITESTYASHENGTRGITLFSARKYARILEVNEAWLLTGEGKMKPEGFAESHQATALYHYPRMGAKAAQAALSERGLHKIAFAIAKEVLANKHDHVTFEEANDLAWRMVDLAKQLHCEKNKVNAEMAEWLLTW